MKIIISHDVDHLYNTDHIFRDLFFIKLWVRETINLIKKRITFNEWFSRCSIIGKKQINNINALMDFDLLHGVKATYFFGMSTGLGMSYKKSEAKDVIQIVHKKGFDTGVHGVNYTNFNYIKKEYDDFYNLVGIEPCGIRMHYVRYDEDTFNKESLAGYSFDTTEFYKKSKGDVRSPYAVGDMIEFPVAIMDSYLPDDLIQKKEETIKMLQKCKKNGLEFVSVLFHDYYFCEAYKETRDWYKWFIEYVEESPEHQFVSYLEAIKEIKCNDRNNTICK